MCGARLALCSAPNAHPFKKLYDRTLRVAVFFCLLRSPFAQPHSALPPILVRQTIKTACNASTSSASSYQISILKRPLTLKVQHYGTAVRASLPQQCTAAASLMTPCLTCTLVACICPLCTIDVPPDLSGNARICSLLGHQQAMHKALSPRSLNRPHTPNLCRQSIAAPAAAHHPIN